MKELQEILKKVSNFAPDEKAILATVVDVQGSGYRRAGARMLIDENGFSIGTVSGGCLEADVLERTKKVLETGEPQVFVYDTTALEDSVFSLNMGCRGVIRILLETISSQDKYLEFLERFWLENLAGVVITTLISPSENIPNKIGSKLLTIPDFIFHNEFDNVLENKLLKIAENTICDKKSQIVTVEDAEFFFEYLPPQVLLTIFGAGTDAIPLCNFAKNLGWRVSIIDHRPAFATKDRFPLADNVSVMMPEDFGVFTPSDGNYATVAMSHNYSRDKDIIWRFLNTTAFYVGALGPKKRTEKILQELAEEGKKFPPENLANLYAPIGLDIGANSPEAIALAIIAEINAVLANRNGGFLRERQGSIYER